MRPKDLIDIINDKLKKNDKDIKREINDLYAVCIIKNQTLIPYSIHSNFFNAKEALNENMLLNGFAFTVLPLKDFYNNDEAEILRTMPLKISDLEIELKTLDGLFDKPENKYENEFNVQLKDKQHIGTMQIGDTVMSCYCSDLVSHKIMNKPDGTLLIKHRLTIIEV